MHGDIGPGERKVHNGKKVTEFPAGPRSSGQYATAKANDASLNQKDYKLYRGAARLCTHLQLLFLPYDK